jgi:hypothetical protein
MFSRTLGLGLLLGCALMLTACPLHWVVRTDASNDRGQALVQRHRVELERAAALLDKAKVSFPIHATGLLNYIGFETAHQEEVLAIYLNGNLVTNNMTRFQRAVASLGDDAGLAMRTMNTTGLLEPNPDYRTLKLTQFYMVRDAIMTSEIGGALTAEPESAVFYFPIAAAKAYSDNHLDQKALINQTAIAGEDGQPLSGHLY